MRRVTNSRRRMVLAVAGLTLLVALAVFSFVMLNETRSASSRWLWAPLLVALTVVALLVAGWIRARAQPTKAALVTFVTVPAVVALLILVVLVPAEYQLMSLRIAFLAVVCLLPATMWYLFIATRKASLLNEFLANLARLGLLQPTPNESEHTRRRRTSSYLQKFEALYGDLPEVVHDEVRSDQPHDDYTRTKVKDSTGLSTTTVPVLFSTVLITLGWLLVLPPGEVLVTNGTRDGVDVPMPWIAAFTPTSAAVTLTFLGAYFFSMQMLFRRYALKDLRGSAYVAFSMRVILAVIGTWVLVAVNAGTGVLTRSELFALAFAIGVFPLIIWQIIESVLMRVAGLVLPSLRAQLPISDLDGLTIWHQTRLEEEDIEELPNMATADIVDLLLNTRIPAERIIDWVDQAILYTQLGMTGKDSRTTLRAHGIRTATSFLRVSADATKRGARADFEKLLVTAGSTRMPALEAALRTNSNLDLVLCWRGMKAKPSPPVHVTGNGAGKPAKLKTPKLKVWIVGLGPGGAVPAPGGEPRPIA